ncbi:MAG: hypothetical protein FWG98_15105 [Candidatus Cloacimonetes bacterium]|nr:hypothetical protein [Candidatus Cloacimonadota bacterium]
MPKAQKNVCKTAVSILILAIMIAMLITSCDEFELTNPSTQQKPLVEAPPWDEEIHEPNMLDVEISGLSSKFIPWKGYEIEMTINENGQIQVGIESFDKIAVEYDFIDMEFWSEFQCPDLGYPDVWLGHLVHRGYVITLRDGRVIQEALNALLNDSRIPAARYQYKHRPIENPPFDPEMHEPNELWISLNQNIFGIIELGFEPRKNEYGQTQIGHDLFDEIAVKYNIIDMKQLHFLQSNFPDEKYWSISNNLWGYDCRYNDFLITIKDNELINDVFDELLKSKITMRVDFKNKRSKQ